MRVEPDLHPLSYFPSLILALPSIFVFHRLEYYLLFSLHAFFMCVCVCLHACVRNLTCQKRPFPTYEKCGKSFAKLHSHVSNARNCGSKLEARVFECSQTVGVGYAVMRKINTHTNTNTRTQVCKFSLRWKLSQISLLGGYVFGEVISFAGVRR